jgi:hypothetical protein
MRGDALAACALAMLMTAAWALRDWPQLAALRLPDTDDAMRLVQIRDWIGGQRFADMSQHRLAGGMPMHWSRLPGLVPGGLIVLLTPLLGRHAAELCAVIAWPGLLFAAALFLVARIARALDADTARIAVVVAVIAFPATTIFLPGRIDHHNLQIVLLLGIALSLVQPPSLGRGLAAGLCATASVVIGLETVPLIAAAGAVMLAEWIAARPLTHDRMMGFGIAFAAGLLGASLIFRPEQWAYPACDSFTGIFWRGAVIAAFAPMLIALSAREMARPPMRALLGLGLGGVVAIGAIAAAPQCLSPYGGVDPLLARLWLGRVGEAQPLFAAPLATAIGYAGVMIAGIAAGAWRWRATRDVRWAALLALQIAAFALTCWQLRGAYAGAILAAPALAATIVAARRKGVFTLIGAWLGSAGMLYPIAAHAVVPGGTPGKPAPQADCTSPAALAALARLPRGTILAPLDLGPYVLAATPHDVIAAPYHRNNAGNLASYRFFLDPAAARATARAWHVDYVALCDTSFTELPQEPAMAARLRAGQAPGWLQPLAIGAPGLKVWRVR